MNKITTDEYNKLDAAARELYLKRRESWLEMLVESSETVIRHAFEVLEDSACQLMTEQLRGKFRAVSTARDIAKSIADGGPGVVDGIVSSLEAAASSTMVKCKTCGAEDNRECGCPCPCPGCVTARMRMN